MKLIRGSGILLHPTSLPGNFGIGDLKEAFAFIDFCAATGQSYWQVLPFNPPGFGDSPYQCFSAFAGNPLLISPEKLLQKGLLENKDLENAPQFNDQKVEFNRVKSYKDKLFRIAFQKFKPEKSCKYKNFVKENFLWLDNYSLFMALKNHFNGAAWHEWGSQIAQRDRETIKTYSNLLQDEIEYQKFLQFEFYTQWLELKEYANSKGIKVIGDIPIFVAFDSADVWANPHLFSLDERGNPLMVAGVPPDYFSKTGQLWGNPHYDWVRMEQDAYKWWRERFITILNLVDFVRLDHFRGFEAYWEIPFGERTAVNGRWVKGPGESFFHTLEKYLGKLPIIAEDLGIITEEVKQLKDKFSFPGMHILQFSLEDTTREFNLPVSFEENSLVYTGTHDNDTIVGWYKKHVLEKTKVAEIIEKKLGISSHMHDKEISWRFIRLALESNSILAIIPLQDILGLDSWARMNYPGTLGCNWNWRYKKGDLTKEIEIKLKKLVQVYNR